MVRPREGRLRQEPRRLDPGVYPLQQRDAFPLHVRGNTHPRLAERHRQQEPDCLLPAQVQHRGRHPAAYQRRSPHPLDTPDARVHKPGRLHSAVRRERPYTKSRQLCLERGGKADPQMEGRIRRDGTCFRERVPHRHFGPGTGNKTHAAPRRKRPFSGRIHARSDRERLLREHGAPYRGHREPAQEGIPHRDGRFRFRILLAEHDYHAAHRHPENRHVVRAQHGKGRTQPEARGTRGRHREIPQVDTLKEMGCQIIQGYFFSKPVPPKDFVPFIENELERRRGA